MSDVFIIKPRSVQFPSIHIGAEWDNDAGVYLRKTGLPFQNAAMWFNDAVMQLKSTGVWEHIYEWFPFVGGNSYAHSLGVMGRQATYNGSPSHTNKGIEFTVNTQYMDFGFAAGSLPQYTNALSFYCNQSTATATNKVDLGGNNGTGQRHLAFSYAGAGGAAGLQAYDNSGLPNTTTTALHMIHGVINNSSNRKLYVDGVAVTNNNTAITGTVPTANYRLGLVASLVATLRRYCDVTFFDSAIDDTHVANHHRIIHQLQTRLNRPY